MSINAVSSYNFGNSTSGYGAFGIPTSGIASGNILYTLSTISGNSKIIGWNLSTLTPLGSSAFIAQSDRIALLNAASAICISTVGTTATIVNLSTLYTTSFSVTNANNYYYAGTISNQSICSLSGSIFTLSASATSPLPRAPGAGCIVKVTPNTSIVIPIAAIFNTYPTCLLAGTSSIFVGTDNGSIVEVDLNGNLLKSIQLYTTPAFGNYITGLSYSDGILTVTTSQGEAYSIDWYSAPKIIKFIPVNSGLGFLNGYSTSLCPSSSGCSVMGFPQGAKFIDSARGQFKTQGIAAGPYTSCYVQSSGISSSIYWQVAYTGTYGSSYTLSNYSLIPESTVEATHSIKSSGVYVPGRKIVIVDNGSPNSYVDSDRPIPAGPVTYPVPIGKSIVEISLYGSGIGKQGEVSMYNT